MNLSATLFSTTASNGLPWTPWGPSKRALGRWPPPEQKEGKPTAPQASPFYSNSTPEVRKQGLGRELLGSPTPPSHSIPSTSRLFCKDSKTDRAVGVSPFAEVAEAGREARGRLRVLCTTLRSRLSLGATLRCPRHS